MKKEGIYSKMYLLSFYDALNIGTREKAKFPHSMSVSILIDFTYLVPLRLKSMLVCTVRINY